jgi:hypothetical protein
LADKYPSSSGGAEAVERQDVRLDGRVLSWGGIRKIKLDKRNLMNAMIDIMAIYSCQLFLWL